MTIQEFNKTAFGKGDKAIYKGETYPIASVEFEECLLGLLMNIDSDEPDDISWVRCENITFIHS